MVAATESGKNCRCTLNSSGVKNTRMPITKIMPPTRTASLSRIFFQQNVFSPVLDK